MRRFITFLDAAYEMKVKIVFLGQSNLETLCIDAEEQDIDKVDAMHLEMMGEMMYDFQTMAQGADGQKKKVSGFFAFIFY